MEGNYNQLPRSVLLQNRTVKTIVLTKSKSSSEQRPVSS
jgi:hypothetical protein